MAICWPDGGDGLACVVTVRGYVLEEILAELLYTSGYRLQVESRSAFVRYANEHGSIFNVQITSGDGAVSGNWPLTSADESSRFTMRCAFPSVFAAWLLNGDGGPA